MPPSLTGTAHKLRMDWMRAVLTEGRRVRPWMSLRMPQFGKANVGRLPELLAAVEGIAPDDKEPKVPATAERIAAGRQLVGKSALGCVSCHDLAGIPNSGTRGPDLASMTQRVRYDWYRRLLEQPQRMMAGTRMPGIFTDGKSPLKNVLDGSADAQAQAMWAYLALGPKLPLPDGFPEKRTPKPMDDKPTYPPTRTDDVVEKLHGVAVADPYRWLEDGSNAEVKEWVEKQNAFTTAVLDKVPGRAAIHKRLGTLLDIGFIGTPVPVKGRLFWTRTSGSSRIRRSSTSAIVGMASRRVLLDVNQLAADGTVALDWWYPSRDGKLLAYGLSRHGNEQSTLHVRDVATGKDLPEKIDRTRACSLTWLPDGSGFYYTRYPMLRGENYNRRVFFHQLGDDPAKDAEIFGEDRAKEDWPNVTLSPDGRWLVVTVSQGWAQLGSLLQGPQ